MKISLLVLFACWLSCLPMAFADEPANDDTVAIEKTIASYIAAFNQGGAEALASHWTESGEQVATDGESIKGRVNLNQQFAAYFAAAKGVKLQLEGTSITLLSPSVAMETGIAHVLMPDEDPITTEYEAIHVMTADGWKVDRVTEFEPAEEGVSHYEQLKELEWMIGTWSDNDENSTVETTCRWTTNRNFIARSFKVFIDDQVDFEGTQIIGWDPASKSIRSWLFDSDGGFAVARWTGNDGKWTATALSVLADGRRASSTNIYELVDENTVRYRSIGRQVAAELLPSIGPITVVRNN